MENDETIVIRVSEKPSSPNMELQLLRRRIMELTSTTSDDKVMGHDDDDDNDLHRPLLVTNGGDDGGNTTLNDSGANEAVQSTTILSPRPCSSTRNIFPDDFSAAVSSGTNYARGGGGGATDSTVTTLQYPPFDTAFKSQGGGMSAAAASFPFTAAQWKELERQAMIYKYMVASLPVPFDLLRNFPDPTNPLVNGSLYSLRYPNTDPELGRCKRTDGKKWRCSRDVAPYHKYCERHMNRGRPRSRKPVEVHPSVDSTTNKKKKKKTRLNQTPILQSNPTTTFPNQIAQPNHTTKDPPNISKSFYKEPNRVNLGWMMDGEMVATNGIEQQWLDLMDNERERNSIYSTNDSSIFLTEEPLNSFFYPDLVAQEDMQSRNNNDSHDLFFNSNMISLKQPQMDNYPISRGFIDALSSGNI